MENKILELLESATVEDLISNREIFARHGKHDQVAAIQEILDRLLFCRQVLFGLLGLPAEYLLRESQE